MIYDGETLHKNSFHCLIRHTTQDKIKSAKIFKETDKRGELEMGNNLLERKAALLFAQKTIANEEVYEAI